MPDKLTFHLCRTNHGWIGLLLSARGLRAATLPRDTQDEALRELMEMGASGPALEATLDGLPEKVRAIASGQPADGIARYLDWDGITPFRRAVLEEAMGIPPGETRSYGWLAAKAGRPRAARAVGRVMATNPFPVIVPCHRVVASNGALHGYGGGLEMKERLLRAEGAMP